MIARMPLFSSRLTSPTVKPSRLSISSCDSTRSPEFLPLPKSRLPSSTMAAHCRAIDSVSSLAAASCSAAAGSSLSSEASHCAAMASWSTGSLPAIVVKSCALLNHDFLEQHGADLDRRDRVVHPSRQLLLEAEQAGRTGEVGGAQLAQIGLEDVGDARHGRLDLLDLLLFLELEDDLHLQILHPLAGIAGQVDQHVRHVDEHRRLHLHRFRVLLAFIVVAEEKEIGRRSPAKQGEHADDHHDQLEFALGLGADFSGLTTAAFGFVVCHCRSVRLLTMR